MKKLLSLTMIASLAIMASCSFFEEKVIPLAKEKASEAVSVAIVKKGQCIHPEVVKAATDKLFKVESDESALVSSIAEAQPTEAQPKSFAAGSSIGSGVCKAAVTVALSPLLKKAVPAEWGCELTDLTAELEAIASSACDKI